MKKIFRVESHDTFETDYPCTSPMYFVAESEEQLRKDFERDNEGLVVIDWITEVTVEEVVNQLNLHIE